MASDPARAEWVTRNVEVGDLPRAIGVNPVTNRVYVALENAGSVFAYEPLIDAGGETTVGTAPNAIAVNPLTNRIYIANQGSLSVSVQDGTTHQIIATVPVGSNPYALVVNPATNRVFVANRLSNSVTVIDGETNSVVTTVPVQSDPRSLAVNPLTNKVYVANRGSARVTVIDGSTYATTPVNVGSFPNAIAVNPTTNFIYVANQGSSSVTRINGATNATNSIPAGNNPYAIAVDPVLNKIYVTNVVGNSVTVINGVTNGTTTVAAGVNPVSIAVNAAIGRAYVCNLGSTFLTIIDGVTNGAQSLTVGSSGLCAAINPWTGRVYVARNIGSGDGLIEIDATTNVVSQVSVGPGQTAVAVNRRTHRAYITNAPNDLVAEVDLTTLTGGPLIGVGDGPTAILTDELRDRIWVANSGGNSVSCIDGQTRTVTTVSVGRTPVDLALDHRGNRVFATNAGSGSVSVIDGASFSVATVAVGAGPTSVAFDPVGNVCYTANRLANTVTLIAADLSTQSIPVGASPARLAIDPATHRVFVTNSGANSMTVIDGATRKVTCTLPVPGMPVAVAIDPIRGRVFVADSSGQRVTALDQTDWRRRYISVAPQPVALALNQWSGRLYIGCLDSPQTTVVDLNGLGAATLSLPSDVLGIAVDEDLGRAVAALTLIGEAAVVTEVVHTPAILTSAVMSLPNDEAAAVQDFAGTATSTRAPNNAGIVRTFLALGTPSRPWDEATITSGAGTPSVTWERLALPTGPAGLRHIKAAAIDQTGATLDNSSHAAASIFSGESGSNLFTSPSTFTPPTPQPLPVINVEVDWLFGEDHDHRPQECELLAVQSAFFRNGYYLNFVYDDAIPEQSAWLEFDLTGDTPFNQPSGPWYDLEDQYRDHPEGTGPWHYVLFGHCMTPQATGGGEKQGDELLVAMGARCNQVGTAWDRAASFMHELGHNLGLDHAGPINAHAVQGEYKPNYPSVMNYRYQLRGVKTGMLDQGLATGDPPLWELDYSHGCLAQLNEFALAEIDGIGYGAVNWDCSGGSGDVVSRDVSSAVAFCPGGGSSSEITDYDDWGHITDFVALGAGPALAGTTAAVCGFGCIPESCPLPYPQPDPCDFVVAVPNHGSGAVRLALSTASPNPSRHTAKLRYYLPESGLADLAIFDVAGRRVRALVNQWHGAGAYEVEWDGRDESGRSVGAGVFLARLRTRLGTLTRRLIRL